MSAEALLSMALLGLAALIVLLVRVELRLARMERRISERNEALARVLNLNQARHLRSIAESFGGHR